MHAPPRSCSPSGGAVGKSKNFYTAPQGARRSPPRCMGHCGKRVMFGDRCPECARELRQRRKRKPR
jgi:hypothetical protein